MNKLSAVFNKSASEWLEVDFTDWSYSSGGYFNDFKAAILERRVAEFDYYSTYGEKTRRRIEPIQIWFKSKAWYIKGYCLTRCDVRLFKLTRVRNLTLTDERFDKKDLLAFSPDSEQARPHKTDIMLKLKVAPEMTYRVLDDFDERMVEKQPGGGFIVSVCWPEDEWVYGYLLSFGEYAEVLEPAHIREIIKDRARKIVEKYL